MKRALRLLAAATIICTVSQTAQARPMDEDADQPSALAMFGDAVIVRPVMAVGTVGGLAVYTVMLPFSVLGDNEGEAAEVLVKNPARATFLRCLGCTPTQHERKQAEKKIREANVAQ